MRIAQHVGRHKRVLIASREATILPRMLEARACQTVVVEIERGWSLSDMDLRGGTNEDLTEPFEREEGAIVGHRFDVIIAPDLLGWLDDPRPALQAMKKQLRPGGSLVVALTGIADFAGRPAIAGGRSLGAESRLLFTYDSLLGLLEEAGYIIGQVARFEPKPDATGAELGDCLIVAYPAPIPGLDFLQQQMRDLLRREQDALREVEDLRRNAERADRRLEILTGHAKRLEERVKDLRSKLLAAHTQSVLRDDEIRATFDDNITLLGAVRHERDVLACERESLADRYECLLHERDALKSEREALRDERDFLSKERDTLARSLRSAIARLNIVRWSPPGIAYRAIRKLLSMRAGRTA